MGAVVDCVAVSVVFMALVGIEECSVHTGIECFEHLLILGFNSDSRKIFFPFRFGKSFDRLERCAGKFGFEVEESLIEADI